MLKLATDEDFSGPLISGLLRAEPALDIRRVVDAGLAGHKDDELLSWAAQEGRILLSRDVNTMIACAKRRVLAGMPMPGLFVVTQQHVSRELIDQLLLYSLAAEEGDFECQIVYFPVRA